VWPGDWATGCGWATGRLVVAGRRIVVPAVDEAGGERWAEAAWRPGWERAGGTMGRHWKANFRLLHSAEGKGGGRGYLMSTKTLCLGFQLGGGGVSPLRYFLQSVRSVGGCISEDVRAVMQSLFLFSLGPRCCMAFPVLLMYSCLSSLLCRAAPLRRPKQENAGIFQADEHPSGQTNGVGHMSTCIHSRTRKTKR
jgi:hypothetical protein